MCRGSTSRTSRSTARRLFVDRGSDAVLAFPLAYVGGRATELLRDIYDRLNAANGYRRFTPS